MSEQWVVIPNWDRFQHYRDRRPPWVKAYVELLDNEDYMGLSLSARGVLHGLWLSYASHRGVLSVSGARRELVRSAADARRVREHLESLIHAGFLEISASKPLPFRYARERDREKEVDTPLPPSREGGVDNGTPRQRGVNPRAATKQSKERAHDDMVAAVWDDSRLWSETRSDHIHERIDEYERTYGAAFTDQERERVVDHVIANASPL